MLKAVFEVHGPVDDVVTFPGRMYAFVNFQHADDAARAQEALDGKEVSHPLRSEPPPPSPLPLLYLLLLYLRVCVASMLTTPDWPRGTWVGGKQVRPTPLDLLLLLQLLLYQPKIAV